MPTRRKPWAASPAIELAIAALLGGSLRPPTFLDCRACNILSGSMEPD